MPDSEEKKVVPARVLVLMTVQDRAAMIENIARLICSPCCFAEAGPAHIRHLELLPNDILSATHSYFLHQDVMKLRQTSSKEELVSKATLAVKVAQKLLPRKSFSSDGEIEELAFTLIHVPSDLLQALDESLPNLVSRMREEQTAYLSVNDQMNSEEE